MILGQNQTSSPLSCLARWLEVPSYVGETIEDDYAYYFPYATKHIDTLYPLFYCFYLLTCLSNLTIADCVVDMTEISENPQSRAAAEQRLRDLGLDVSLSDCNLPRYTTLLPSDREWVAYEGVARKLLRLSLPASLWLPPGWLKDQEPSLAMLGSYFRSVASEFELQPRGENQMPDTAAALSSDERHHQGTLLFEKGQYGEALPLIEEALGEQETGERWSDWGAVQRALGNRENAERGFRKALGLDPNLAVAATNLGVLLFEAGRLEEAEPFLKPACGAANGQGHCSRKCSSSVRRREFLPQCPSPSARCSMHIAASALRSPDCGGWPRGS